MENLCFFAFLSICIRLFFDYYFCVVFYCVATAILWKFCCVWIANPLSLKMCCTPIIQFALGAVDRNFLITRKWHKHVGSTAKFPPSRVLSICIQTGNGQLHTTNLTNTLLLETDRKPGAKKFVAQQSQWKPKHEWMIEKSCVCNNMKNIYLFFFICTWFRVSLCEVACNWLYKVHIKFFERRKPSTVIRYHYGH